MAVGDNPGDIDASLAIPMSLRRISTLFLVIVEQNPFLSVSSIAGLWDIGQGRRGGMTVALHLEVPPGDCLGPRGSLPDPRLQGASQTTGTRPATATTLRGRLEVRHTPDG